MQQDWISEMFSECQKAAILRSFIKHREAEGLSIRKASAIVGVSFSALARLERGEGEASYETLKRMKLWVLEGLPSKPYVAPETEWDQVKARIERIEKHLGLV